jgi:hypothetical protein
MKYLQTNGIPNNSRSQKLEARIQNKLLECPQRRIGYELMTQLCVETSEGVVIPALQAFYFQIS